MPLLWDIMMSCVTGFMFSSLKPLLKNTIDIELHEKALFVIGLVFNQLVILLISVWCWFEVDPNWLMLYWVDPESVRPLVHLIYVIFPVFYIIPYVLNLKLHKIKKSRYSLLISNTAWLIFTIIVFPSFITMFAGNDAPYHGVDYTAQLQFNLINYPEKSPLWIFPMSLRSYFIFFFIQITFFMALVEILGISIARRDSLNRIPSKSPKFLNYLAGKILDISNGLIIKNAKKDMTYRRFVESFKATIQISTKDGIIHRFLVFDGKGGFIYGKGKIGNPDATVMYTSARDLFIFLKNLGNYKEAIRRNRFKLYGNMNVLLKLEFLTNYFNPRVKNIKGSKLKIKKSLKGTN